jgi:hypothetical protein
MSMNPAFIKRNTVCVVLMLGIITACCLVGIRNPVSFWYADDDYAYLSLAHALSFDQWLRGNDYQIGDTALVGHPGIPFYLVSWISFKIALPAAAQGFIEIFSGQSDVIERFWFVSRGVALLLALAGIMLIFRAATGRLAVVTAAAATILFLAASDQPWVAMSRLGIESFALPYALLFYLAAKNAFSDQRRDMIAWAIFGLVGGLGYTLKFHYVAFTLGSAAGLMAMLAVGSSRLSEALKLGIAYVAGFVVGFGLFAMPILGWSGISNLLRFHFSIATHSGYYGEGEADVVSSAQVLRAIDLLALMPALIATFLLVVAGAVYVMLMRRTDGDWRGSGFPLGVTLLVALSLAFSAVLKHYQPHYLVVPISIIPLMVLYVADNVGAPSACRILIALAGAFGLLSLPFTLLQFDRLQGKQFAIATRVIADVTEIEARPLGSNEIRVWDYRVPTRGFGVGFIVGYAGSSAISEWYQRVDLRDRYAQILPHRSWRYAVLSKASYATALDVSGRWWGFKPGDRVEVLREAVLVERRSADTP